jgi:GGDEF domain-containing protein
MNVRDFQKLAATLKADFKLHKDQPTRQATLLFRMVEAFQVYATREHGNKYREFVEFSRPHALSFRYALPDIKHDAQKQVGRHASEAKTDGSALEFVPMMLFYQWTETRHEFLKFLEEARDHHEFIADIVARELAPEHLQPAHDTPKILFIAASGRGEIEARDVNEIAERLSRYGIIVETILVDGANAVSVGMGLPKRIDAATLTIICLSNAIMRKPWQQAEFQLELRNALVRDGEVIVLGADTPLTTLSSKDIVTDTLLTLELSYGPEKLFEELSRAVAKRISGFEAFANLRKLIRHKHDGMNFLENELNQPLDRARCRDLGLAIMDVDGMTNINRTFGEHVGDAVIRRIEDTLIGFATMHGGNAGQCGDDAFYLALRGDGLTELLSEAIERLANIEWSSIAPSLWASLSIGTAFRSKNSDEPGIDVAIRAMLGMKEAKRPGSSGVEAGPALLPHTSMFDRSNALRRGFS